MASRNALAAALEALRASLIDPSVLTVNLTCPQGAAGRSIQAASGAAWADGMAFYVTGGSSDVRATAQRALLWLRQGTWELHIQPVFEREAGAAAWVLRGT